MNDKRNTVTWHNKVTQYEEDTLGRWHTKKLTHQETDTPRNWHTKKLAKQESLHYLRATFHTEMTKQIMKEAIFEVTVIKHFNSSSRKALGSQVG